jgi:phosphohistidine phosphatase
MAAEALGYTGKLVETEALLPDATPQGLWQEIREHKNAGEVLLAGHEPQLSQAVAYFLGTPELRVDLKKGALVRLDVEGLQGEPHGVLRWLITAGVC